jgi:glutamate-5-semialdehyde dehydrogenase
MTSAVTPMGSRADDVDIRELMQVLGRAATAAAAQLALANAECKNRALTGAASALRAQLATILAANAQDMQEAQAATLGSALLDRLMLDAERVEAMAVGLNGRGPMA